MSLGCKLSLIVGADLPVQRKAKFSNQQQMISKTTTTDLHLITYIRTSRKKILQRTFRTYF